MERAVHGHLASVWTIPITPDSNAHFSIRLFRQSDFLLYKIFIRGYPRGYIGPGRVESIERSSIFQLIHHKYGHFRKGHPKGQK